MEVWLCDYASVITEPNFHAFSQTCWGFGHPRKGTTCCTVLNCRPFDFFNLLKNVSRKSWSCWWSLTWIFVCLLQYSLQISNENWTYRLLPWLSLCGLFWTQKCPVWAFVAPSSNILSFMVLTSSNTVKQHYVKGCQLCKVDARNCTNNIWSILWITKGLSLIINFALPCASAKISTHSHNCEVFTNMIYPQFTNMIHFIYS